MSVLCVLPARLASERLPRKPLRVIAGRTLLEWSWLRACRAGRPDEVWIATDDESVAREARSFGATVVMTDPGHPSGTDRVAEAAATVRARSFEVVVNYQADEPFLDPDAVDRAVAAVERDGAPVATLSAPLRSSDEWRSEAVVKVVCDAAGDALYFSRAPIPWPRGGEADFDGAASGAWVRHVGLYVFTREALQRWTALPPSPLEQVERLEQLRALEAGMRIRVVAGPPTEPGVDEPRDLRRARRLLGRDANHQRDGSHA